jgi:molybdopterin/thiamine biosynthesis adenylyltransferase
MDDQELERYARHILLPEIGGAGQNRLLGAKVQSSAPADWDRR